MKTTVDISDELLLRSRRLARKRGVTLRALIEDGLRHALRELPAGPDSAAFAIPVFGDGGLAEPYLHAGLQRAILDTYAEREVRVVSPELPASVHDSRR